MPANTFVWTAFLVSLGTGSVSAKLLSVFVLKSLSLRCTDLRLSALAVVDLTVLYTYFMVDRRISMADEVHVGNMARMYLACRELLEIRAQIEVQPVLVADAISSNPLLSVHCVREYASVMIVCSKHQIILVRLMMCPDHVVRNSIILVVHTRAVRNM